MYAPRCEPSAGDVLIAGQTPPIGAWCPHHPGALPPTSTQQEGMHILTLTYIRTHAMGAYPYSFAYPDIPKPNRTACLNHLNAPYNRLPDETRYLRGLAGPLGCYTLGSTFRSSNSPQSNSGSLLPRSASPAGSCSRVVSDGRRTPAAEACIRWYRYPSQC